PAAGLADPARLARDIPDLDLYFPWRLAADEAIDAARRCEAAALAVDPRLGNSEGADISTEEGVRVYGNTNGFLAGFPASQHAVSCVVLGGEGSGMQRDYWFSTARDPEDLEPAEAVGRRAGERTVDRLGARRVATASVPVLFAAPVARSLFGHFVGAVSGGSLYRKASFLLDTLGEQLFPEFLDLREEPHLPKALGSTPFDGEGVATVPRTLVDRGVLQGYLLSSYSARRLGMETTGNAGGVHNLCVTPGERDFDDLVRDMGRGLVVTHLMGQGVNPVTGDYSRGAAGFWVENGRIAYPVEEITVAGNLRDVFRQIVAVGRDVDTRGSIRTGSVLVDRMTVAGE
ncbi:MAG TPA: metalloprotease PmbA, partial [Gammaproteobacteria bacterium]|nr:metalloprotease PmbA [Gammaproteobacteria bacterium]